MHVTDLDYQLENRFIKKANLMIERCEQVHPKKDVVFNIEGDEGEGKTNSACALAYYVKYNTKRNINLFFRLKNLIKMAQNTERQIFIWDEPSLDSLSTDHYKEINKDLMRLLMTSRVNRHFYIFNLTKFHKFAEYIVVDRARGMMHMYSRDEIEPGHFVYIKKKALEPLFIAYKVSKKRLYKKYTSFHGKMQDILEIKAPDGSCYFDKMGINVEGIQNATYQQYNDEKRKAIMSIGNEKTEKNQYKDDFKRLKKLIASIKYPINTQEQLAEALETTSTSLVRWKNLSFDDSDD